MEKRKAMSLAVSHLQLPQKNRYFKNSIFVLSLILTAGVFQAQSQVQTSLEREFNNVPAPKTTTKTAKTSGKKGGTATKSSSPTISRIKRKNGNSQTKVLETANRYKVTIQTGVPGVELWLNGNRIGVSNDKSQVSAFISSGAHQIVAKKDERDLGSPLPIEVSYKQTDFDFSEQLRKAASDLPSLPPKEETKVVAKTEDSGEVDAVAVMEAYKDPEKTSSVTLKDWEAIYKQSMNKMLSGSTSQDLEAVNAFAQGQIELAAGNRPKAISSFSAATVFSPKSALAHYGLGLAYLAAGQTADAATAFQKSIQLENKFALPYKHLGDILLAQGKNKEAGNHYQQAIKLGLNSTEIRLNLAASQIKTKNCSAAVKELEVLEKEAPSAPVYLALGECYMEMERAVSAIEALTKAIELDPDNAAAHFKLGEIYLKQKEFEKAKKSLERSLALDVEGKAIKPKEVKELIERARKKVRE